MQLTGENRVPGDRRLIFCLKNNGLFFSQYQTYLKASKGFFVWLVSFISKFCEAHLVSFSLLQRKMILVNTRHVNLNHIYCI